MIILMTALALLMQPQPSYAFPESAPNVKADFDGDNLPDEAFVHVDASTKALSLIVRFGSGSETQLLNDADPSGPVHLEVRGSGDPRCPNWLPKRTCGRNFDIHKGPALVVRQAGERDLLFYWVRDTKFLLERGYHNGL